MFTLEQIKENRRKWVEALRSGKYRQTTDVLANGNGGFCCLGVLSDLAGCEWVRADVLEMRTADAPNTAAAGKIAMAFVGLAHSEGAFEEEGNERSRYLAGLNDSGFGFTYIANIIESNPPGLFLTDEEITASLNTGKG